MSNTAAAMDLLKKVQLLQFFDLAGLVESIAEVNESIYRLSQATSQGKQTTTSAINSKTDLQCIVLVEGLAPTLSVAQRRSGLVQANAVLAGLTRSITQLSKLSALPLVLIGVPIEVHPTRIAEVDGELSFPRRDSQGMPLESAFSGPNGERYRLTCGSVTLSRTLEASLDRLVHVHDAVGRAPVRKRHRQLSNQYAIEVIKDRIGSMTGLWSTWQVQKS